MSKNEKPKEIFATVNQVLQEPVYQVEILTRSLQELREWKYDHANHLRLLGFSDADLKLLDAKIQEIVDLTLRPKD